MAVFDARSVYRTRRGARCNTVGRRAPGRAVVATRGRGYPTLSTVLLLALHL